VSAPALGERRRTAVSCNVAIVPALRFFGAPRVSLRKRLTVAGGNPAALANCEGVNPACLHTSLIQARTPLGELSPRTGSVADVR
jgi:hypothetical protein